MDFYNGTSGPVSLTEGSPHSGPSNQANPIKYTSEPVAVVASGQAADPIFSITAPQEKTIDIQFQYMSTTNPGYGCNFEVIFAYQGALNGGITEYYYPNYYASPVYPAGATTIPNCIAESSGPSTAFNEPSGGNFAGFFAMKGF